MRYLELNNDGYVINIIIWDGVTPYDAGYTLVSCDDAPNARFGWRLVDGQWIEPEEENRQD